VKRTLAFTLGLAAFVFGPAIARAAETGFSDRICTNATQSVRDYDTQSKNPNTPVDDILATLNKVVEAYRVCAAEKLTQGGTGSGGEASLQVGLGVEGMHYAQIRQAQFYYVMGRIERLLQNYNTSHDNLQTAIGLVKDTIDWRTSPDTVMRSNNVNVGSSSGHSATTDVSNYRESAIQIRDAALAEMALLPKPGAAPSPAPK
jgi:hypothetical protein